MHHRIDVDSHRLFFAVLKFNGKLYDCSCRLNLLIKLNCVIYQCGNRDWVSGNWDWCKLRIKKRFPQTLSRVYNIFFQRNTYVCIVHSSFKSYHDFYRILNYGKYSNYARVVRCWLLVLYIHSLPYTKQQTIVSGMNGDFHDIRIRQPTNLTVIVCRLKAIFGSTNFLFLL